MAILDRLKSLVERPFSASQKRLMMDRSHYSKEEFLQQFPNDMAIASHGWDALVQEAVIEGFKPKTTDNLLQVFGLVDDDLDELALKLLTDCGCRIPTPSETLKMQPIQTVGDLIHFILQMRQIPSAYDAQ